MKDKEKHFKIIFNKMCETAGHQERLDDFLILEDDNWYSTFTMTEQQERTWMEWSVEYLRENANFSKKKAEQEMGWFNLGFGFRVEYQTDKT